MAILHITIATPLGGIRKKMHTCRFCVFEANTLTLQKHTCYSVIANTYTVGFSTVNGNLLLTAVFTNFLLPMFDRNSRGKPNGKFTMVNNIYRKW